MFLAANFFLGGSIHAVFFYIIVGAKLEQKNITMTE